MVLLLLLQSTKLIVARCNHVNVVSCDDDIKVFDWCICCDGGCKETSFIAGALALYCNDEGLQLAWSILSGALWRSHNCWRLWPSCSLWQGACCCLTQSIRTYCGLLLPGTTYAVNCPCGKGLVVTLLDACGFAGMLAILAFCNIHAIFGVLTVLAFGIIHTISSALAVPNFGVLVPWLLRGAKWLLSHPVNNNMNIWLLCGSHYVLSLYLLFFVVAPRDASIKKYCCVVNFVVMVLQSILLLVLHTFAIVDVFDPHQSKRVECCWCNLVCLLWSTVVVAPCNTTEKYCCHCNFLQYDVGHQNLIIALMMLMFLFCCLLLWCN